MKHALLITELVPGYGRSGQETYNADIVEAVRWAGFTIDIVVTSPRFDLIADGYARSRGEWGHMDMLHFVPTRMGLIPRTWPSIARRIKYMLPRREAANGSKAGVAPIGRWLSDGERRAVRRLIADRRPDVILTDTIFRSVAIEEGRERATPDILILHDIFSLRCASFENNGFIAQPKIDEHDEQAIWRRHDGLITINALDGAYVEAAAPRACHQTIYPVVGGMRAKHMVARPSGILFVGADTAHNRDAVAWFLERCWADVLQSVPDATLHVVGAVGNGVKQAPNIVLHGKVDDLAPIAARCSMAINPLQMGSGLKIKMIDYLALGLPCVTTDVGAEGFPDELPQPFIIASDPAEFMQNTVNLLTSADVSRKTSEHIQKYIALFSKNEAIRRMMQVMVNIDSSMQ